MSNAIDSICVLRLSAIGDVCNAVSAVQAIQAQHPAAKITWVIGAIEHTLLADLPGIEFIVFDKKRGKQAEKEFKAIMKTRRFDVLLLMQVALRANLLSRHIKARRRIGFDHARSKELHSLFINERIAPRRHAHVLEGFYDFALNLGVHKEVMRKPCWNIPLSESDTQFATQALTGGQSHLVIVPAASNPERNWLAERYALVADHANRLGFHVTLCGGPGQNELDLAQSIEAECAFPTTNLVGKTTLKQMLALLRRASVVIAPDTGPAHMAVSQHTPVIGLYGHSNPERTGPYLYQHYVVDVYHQFLKQQTGKHVDALPWGKRVKGQHVMAAITTDAVIRMLERVCSDLELFEARSGLTRK